MNKYRDNGQWKIDRLGLAATSNWLTQLLNLKYCMFMQLKRKLVQGAVYSEKKIEKVPEVGLKLADIYIQYKLQYTKVI